MLILENDGSLVYIPETVYWEARMRHEFKRMLEFFIDIGVVEVKYRKDDPAPRTPPAPPDHSGG